MTTMAKADQLVESAADRLQRLADEFAAEGGTRAKLAEELAQDAAFIRKLKPSLMRARFRGEAPTNQPPGSNVHAPSGAQLPPRPEPKPKTKRTGGPNPFVVVGVALVAGIALAKIIDWRGHAHPRD
jgi:hypothetical protein